jgi:hypothetical protein
MLYYGKLQLRSNQPFAGIGYCPQISLDVAADNLSPLFTQGNH